MTILLCIITDSLPSRAHHDGQHHARLDAQQRAKAKRGHWSGQVDAIIIVIRILETRTPPTANEPHISCSVVGLPTSQPPAASRICRAAHSVRAAAGVDFVSRLRGQSYVFRTDADQYYASIDHDILFAQLKQYVREATEPSLDVRVVVGQLFHLPCDRSPVISTHSM